MYQAKDGAIELRGDTARETLWATQAEIATIFGVNPQAVTKHIKHIYAEGELEGGATCSKLEQVRTEGSRAVKRTLDVYNLDMMIAVGTASTPWSGPNSASGPPVPSEST